MAVETELIRRMYYYTFAVTPFRFAHVVYLCKHAPPPVWNQLLSYAIYNTHFKAVKKLIFAGADLHQHEEQALRWSIANGHLKMVKFLCKKGADVNVHGGRPLLLACCRKKRMKFMRVLVEYGAHIYDIHLSAAARRGELQMVQFFVEHGADPQARESEALCGAAACGSLSVVQYLLNHGADVHAQGDRPIRAAAQQGHRKLVQYLISRGGFVPYSALWWAVSFGRLKLIKLLLSYGDQWDADLTELALKQRREHVLKYINKRYV